MLIISCRCTAALRSRYTMAPAVPLVSSRHLLPFILPATSSPCFLVQANFERLQYEANDWKLKAISLNKIDKFDCRIKPLIKEWSVKSHTFSAFCSHSLHSVSLFSLVPPLLSSLMPPNTVFKAKLLKDTDHFKLHDTQRFHFMGWVTWFTILFNVCSLHVLEVNALNSSECVSTHLSNLIRWEKGVHKDRATLLYLPEQGTNVDAVIACSGITNRTEQRDRIRAFRQWNPTIHGQIIVINEGIIADVQCVPCWTRVMGIKSPTPLPTKSSFRVLELPMHSAPSFHQISSIAAASRSAILLGSEWMNHWWQSNGR